MIVHQKLQGAAVPYHQKKESCIHYNCVVNFKCVVHNSVWWAQNYMRGS
jgi:hypothetical protein